MSLVWLFTLVAALVAGALVWRTGVRPAGLPLRARRALTANEAEFYFRLRGALEPRYAVLAQVSMGALVDTTLPAAHPAFWPVRRKFDAKVVDYVVCRRPSMAVVCLIELDDATHDAVRDAARDRLTAQVGYRTLRFQARHKPAAAALAAAVRALDA